MPARIWFDHKKNETELIKEKWTIFDNRKHFIESFFFLFSYLATATEEKKMHRMYDF